MLSELGLLYFLTLFISAWCFLQIVKMAWGPTLVPKLTVTEEERPASLY